MHRIVAVYAAPVPVGHRVEVTWFEEVTRGLGGGPPRIDQREHQPLIVDLDTGVRYETDWMLGASRRRSPDAPYEVGEVVRTELREARRLEGVVRSCRVVTVRGFPEYDVQTLLEVE